MSASPGELKMEAEKERKKKEEKKKKKKRRRKKEEEEATSPELRSCVKVEVAILGSRP